MQTKDKLGDALAATLFTGKPAVGKKPRKKTPPASTGPQTTADLDALYSLPPGKGKNKNYLPQTIWITKEQYVKIHNLHNALGGSIRDIVTQLLDNSLTAYEETKGVNLLAKVEKKSVF